MIITSQDAEQRGLEQVAALMCVAARTAPKAKGVDNLETLLVSGEEKDRLSAEMRRIAVEAGMAFFDRDAGCLEKAPVVLLLGQKVKPIGVKPCGYCGHGDCATCAQNGGNCAISIGDLGIAIGSAAHVAAAHHVDNRVIFSAGRAALNLKLFPAEVTIAYAIPLSVSGKNPFFDRLLVAATCLVLHSREDLFPPDCGRESWKERRYYCGPPFLSDEKISHSGGALGEAAAP